MIGLGLFMYGFIRDKRGILVYMFMVLGVMCLSMRIEEVGEEKKVSGRVCFVVGGGVLLMGIWEFVG
nr:DUF3953 domain-containing protein [Bacillus mycoides]